VIPLSPHNPPTRRLYEDFVLLFCKRYAFEFSDRSPQSFSLSPPSLVTKVEPFSHYFLRLNPLRAPFNDTEQETTISPLPFFAAPFFLSACSGKYAFVSITLTKPCCRFFSPPPNVWFSQKREWFTLPPLRFSSPLLHSFPLPPIAKMKGEGAPRIVPLDPEFTIPMFLNFSLSVFDFPRLMLDSKLSHFPSSPEEPRVLGYVIKHSYYFLQPPPLPIFSVSLSFLLFPLDRTSFFLSLLTASSIDAPEPGCFTPNFLMYHSRPPISVS